MGNCSCAKEEDLGNHADLSKVSGIHRSLDQFSMNRVLDDLEDQFTKWVFLNDEDLKKKIEEHGPKELQFVKILQKEPPNSNAIVEKVLKSCDPLNLPPQSKLATGLPYLPPFEVEYGAVYVGQWKNGSKHGRGRQTWKDG